MVGMDGGWRDASKALFGVNFEFGKIEMMDWRAVDALVGCGRAQWSCRSWDGLRRLARCSGSYRFGQ